MSTTLRRGVLRAMGAATRASTAQKTRSSSARAARALSSQAPAFNGSTSASKTHVALAVIGGATLATAWASTHDESARCATEEANASSATEPEGGYEGNPIQHVTALLRIYEQIDQNMGVFAARMLEDLEKTVEKEKRENNGELRLSPEQRALNMSINFESTLEKVQDAVFRNNYVTKAQVQEALQQLVAGSLRGGGPDGKISEAEAEMLEDFVRKLGRLRWKCTGSREPLIPSKRGVWQVPEDKPKIDVATVISVMEELIPSLTREMEEIAAELRKQKLSAADFRREVSKKYVAASGRRTEEICAKYKLELRAFQAALMYYHEDERFEETLARLATEQQQKFKELGL